MRAVLVSSLFSLAACDLTPLPVDGGLPGDAAGPVIGSATGTSDAGGIVSLDATVLDAAPSSDAAPDVATASDAASLEASTATEDGQVAAPEDAALDAAHESDAGSAAQFTIGVNTHNYPKPMAYGYLASDGADRMGQALRVLGVHYARGAIIGDVAFLTRLHEFG